MRYFCRFPHRNVVIKFKYNAFQQPDIHAVSEAHGLYGIRDGIVITYIWTAECLARKAQRKNKQTLSSAFFFSKLLQIYLPLSSSFVLYKIYMAIYVILFLSLVHSQIDRISRVANRFTFLPLNKNLFFRISAIRLLNLKCFVVRVLPVLCVMQWSFQWKDTIAWYPEHNILFKSEYKWL